MHDGKGLRVGVRLGLGFVLGGGPMLLYLRLLAWWAVLKIVYYWLRGLHVGLFPCFKLLLSVLSALQLFAVQGTRIDSMTVPVSQLELLSSRRRHVVGKVY